MLATRGPCLPGLAWSAPASTALPRRLVSALAATHAHAVYQLARPVPTAGHEYPSSSGGHDSHNDGHGRSSLSSSPCTSSSGNALLVQERPRVGNLTPQKLAQLSKLLDLPLKHAERLLSEAPGVRHLTVQQISLQLRDLSVALTLRDRQVAYMVVQQPEFFLLTPVQQVAARVDSLSQRLSVPPQAVIAAAALVPSILKRDPVTIVRKVEQCATMLGASTFDALHAISRAPQFLTCSPGIVQKRLLAINQITRQAPVRICRAVLKQPDIVFMSPRIMNNKISVLGAILDKEKRHIVTLVLKCPQLLRTDLHRVRAVQEVLQELLPRPRGFVYAMVCHDPSFLLESPLTLRRRLAFLWRCLLLCPAWEQQWGQLKPPIIEEMLSRNQAVLLRLQYLLHLKQADSVKLEQAVLASNQAFGRRFPSYPAWLQAREQHMRHLRLQYQPQMQQAMMVQQHEREHAAWQHSAASSSAAAHTAHERSSSDGGSDAHSSSSSSVEVVGRSQQPGASTSGRVAPTTWLGARMALKQQQKLRQQSQAQEQPHDLSIPRVPPSQWLRARLALRLKQQAAGMQLPAPNPQLRSMPKSTGRKRGPRLMLQQEPSSSLAPFSLDPGQPQQLPIAGGTEPVQVLQPLHLPLPATSSLPSSFGRLATEPDRVSTASSSSSCIADDFQEQQLCCQQDDPPLLALRVLPAHGQHQHQQAEEHLQQHQQQQPGLLASHLLLHQPHLHLQEGTDTALDMDLVDQQEQQRQDLATALQHMQLAGQQRSIGHAIGTHVFREHQDGSDTLAVGSIASGSSNGSGNNRADIRADGARSLMDGLVDGGGFTLDVGLDLDTRPGQQAAHRGAKSLACSVPS